MAAYNYFQCDRCMAGPTDVPKNGKFRLAIEQPKVNALATPLCPKCRRSMSMVGFGEAPFAPSSERPNLLIPVLANVETLVHHDAGRDTTGRDVDFTVHENPALARFKIVLTVNGGNPMIATLTTGQVRKAGVAEDWRVRPPFGIRGAGEAWARLNTAAMSNIREMQHSDPANRLPSPFDIRMTLGSHRYGLIHLLAGHFQNTRTWIGTANTSTMVRPNTTDVAVLAAYQREKDEEEGYRSIQGIQKAIGDAVAIAAIRRVIRSGDKYIIYGSSGNRHVKLVVKSFAGEFTVTTMYINDNPNLFAPPRLGEHDVWVRPPGR